MQQKQNDILPRPPLDHTVAFDKECEKTHKIGLTSFHPAVFNWNDKHHSQGDISKKVKGLIFDKMHFLMSHNLFFGAKMIKL